MLAFYQAEKIQHLTVSGLMDFSSKIAAKDRIVGNSMDQQLPADCRNKVRWFVGPHPAGGRNCATPFCDRKKQAITGKAIRSSQIIRIFYRWVWNISESFLRILNKLPSLCFCHQIGLEFRPAVVCKKWNQAHCCPGMWLLCAYIFIRAVFNVQILFTAWCVKQWHAACDASPAQASFCHGRQ